MNTQSLPDNAHEAEKFAHGTFAPAYSRASILKILLAQTRMELLLFLRNGEQVLLSLIIPFVLLLTAHFVPFRGITDIQAYILAVSVAIMGSCFTGTAIATAFDRRYGALKRTAASGVPTWAILAAKILTSMLTVLVQLILLTCVATVIKIDFSLMNWAIFGLAVVLGVFTFGLLGLLLGGTLKPELVLALGNALWLLFLGTALSVTIQPSLPDLVFNILNMLPSRALTELLLNATQNISLEHIFWPAVVTLCVWSVIACIGSYKKFSLTVGSD